MPSSADLPSPHPQGLQELVDVRIGTQSVLREVLQQARFFMNSTWLKTTQKGIEDLHALQLPGRNQFTLNRVRDSSQQHSHRPLLSPWPFRPIQQETSPTLHRSWPQRPTPKPTTDCSCHSDPTSTDPQWPASRQSPPKCCQGTA